MNNIPIDILKTEPLLHVIHLPRTETVRISPLRLRAMQAEVRRLLDDDPIGPREKMVLLLAAIEEKYQRMAVKMPDGLAQMILNVYAVLMAGVDEILWSSQRIHRGLLDPGLIQALLDAVAAIHDLTLDPLVGAQFCSVHDMLAEMKKSVMSKK